MESRRQYGLLSIASRTFAYLTTLRKKIIQQTIQPSQTTHMWKKLREGQRKNYAEIAVLGLVKTWELTSAEWNAKENHRFVREHYGIDWTGKECFAYGYNFFSRQFYWAGRHNNYINHILFKTKQKKRKKKKTETMLLSEWGLNKFTLNCCLFVYVWVFANELWLKIFKMHRKKNDGKNFMCICWYLCMFKAISIVFCILHSTVNMCLRCVRHGCGLWFIQRKQKRHEKNNIKFVTFQVGDD